MSNIYNIQEIKSLISLLDDPDEAVISNVMAEIIRRGPVVMPWLQEAQASSLDPVSETRISTLLQQLHVINIKTRLTKWVGMGQDNLLLGALIVARYQFPELREENIIRRLGHITQDIYLRIKPEMSPIEKIQIVNTVLYDDYEFFGNKRDHLSPQCYYLNLLFDTGKGNHISLGILYMLVARSLGIPVVGVDLNEYFFLAYREDDRMLFYINPFSKGNVLSQAELLFFLKLAEVQVPDHPMEPATNFEIIRTLIEGLIQAYERMDNLDKANEIRELLEAFDGNAADAKKNPDELGL